MPRPSPIHRDAKLDGDDFGCLGPMARKGNRAVLRFIDGVERDLQSGNFTDVDDLIDIVHEYLEEIDRQYDCGACDTVVKENVFAALAQAIDATGLSEFDRMKIYGW